MQCKIVEIMLCSTHSLCASNNKLLKAVRGRRSSVPEPVVGPRSLLAWRWQIRRWPGVRWRLCSAPRSVVLGHRSTSSPSCASAVSPTGSQGSGVRHMCCIQAARPWHSLCSPGWKAHGAERQPKPCRKKQNICHDHVRRTLNVKSTIRLKVFEEHVIEKKKNLLFLSEEKKRSPNPVFLERWLTLPSTTEQWW